METILAVPIWNWNVDIPVSINLQGIILGLLLLKFLLQDFVAILRQVTEQDLDIIVGVFEKLFCLRVGKSLIIEQLEVHQIY